MANPVTEAKVGRIFAKHPGSKFRPEVCGWLAVMALEKAWGCSKKLVELHWHSKGSLAHARI
jgi:hypothetical protein